MLLIAVDPGKTTGVATWYLDRAFEEPMATQIEGSLDFCDYVHALLAGHYDDDIVIICEKYTINAGTLKKSRQYDPLEIIGTLRWFAHQYEIDFVLQSPAEAKRFATNDKLKKIGWYTPGRDHAADAMRHLLLYSVKNGHVNPGDLL